MVGNKQIYYPGSTELLAQRQMVYPASYNLPVGIVERESFLPGANLIQQKIAEIPGAYRNDAFVTAGYSFQPDSYTPGTYQFDAGCQGQAVTVYPERESKVLWCGERNLQGNQTLKRTNIHHNYVHDINHKHNYHNRTRHAAKQFNSVEKDCSCKGVAVEATYKCPPGIEASNARAVASSLIERPVGETFQGTTYGTTYSSVGSCCPYLRPAAGVKTCTCE
jgi:hypothetical protein